MSCPASKLVPSKTERESLEILSGYRLRYTGLCRLGVDCPGRISYRGLRALLTY